MRPVHQLCASDCPFALTLRHRPQQKIQVRSGFRRSLDVLSVDAFRELFRLFVGDGLNQVHFVASNYIHEVLLTNGGDLLDPRLHLEMTHFSDSHHLKCLLHGHVKHQHGSVFR